MHDGTTVKDLGRNLAAAQARAEFDPRNLTAWLGGLRRQGLGLALPALILKLDALTKADLPPLQRVTVLQMLERSVLKAAASLPKPVGGLVSGGGAGVTLEQRLLLLMQGNFRRALTDLSRVEFSEDPEAESARGWAIKNLFAFIEHQILYGIDWGVPWPPGTWQGLYDLHTFLLKRGQLTVLHEAEPDRDDQAATEHAGLDLSIAFKRLLLLGVASQAKPYVWEEHELLKHLREWADQTRLDDPDVHVWEVGVYMVETGKDAPPRCNSGVLEDTFNGFVLMPAPGFLACIGRAQAAEALGLRPL